MWSQLPRRDKMNNCVVETKCAVQSLEGEPADPEGPALQDDPDEGYPYAVLAVLVKLL